MDIPIKHLLVYAFSRLINEVKEFHDFKFRQLCINEDMEMFIVSVVYAGKKEDWNEEYEAKYIAKHGAVDYDPMYFVKEYLEKKYHQTLKE